MTEQTWTLNMGQLPTTLCETSLIDVQYKSGRTFYSVVAACWNSPVYWPLTGEGDDIVAWRGVK